MCPLKVPEVAAGREPQTIDYDFNRNRGLAGVLGRLGERIRHRQKKILRESFLLFFLVTVTEPVNSDHLFWI